MRQLPNGKRSRNRPGRSSHRPQNNRNQTFDSSGPEGKVRGTANQVYEKYLALARDASSSGDRVMAENFFQHAEHYFRIVVASGQQMRPRPVGEFGEEGFEGQDGEGQDGQGYIGEQPQPPPYQGQPQPQPRPQPGNGGPPRAAQEREAPQPQAQPQPKAQVQPQPQPKAQPVAERRPESPAELAQAAAANAEDRERGRRPGRRGSAPVDA